jgi:FAD/FMN-containing dehydrogenase
MWGTAIDNLFSFTIVDAQGRVLEVKRRNHPHRKILPDDTVVFDVCILEAGKSVPLNTITLLGTEIRKKGLGKDITNKALKGLPGVQKEGGDGIITTARFVLYHPFAHCKTICLEFFGSNLINASKAIVDIMNTFEHDAVVFLTALEHFDE